MAAGVSDKKTGFWKTNCRTPEPRQDRGQSKLAPAIQEAILAAKRDNPRRSIRQIRQLLEAAGIAPHDTLSRSSLHRLLQQHGLSRVTGSASCYAPLKTGEFERGVTQSLRCFCLLSMAMKWKPTDLTGSIH